MSEIKRTGISLSFDEERREELTLELTRAELPMKEMDWWEWRRLGANRNWDIIYAATPEQWLERAELEHGNRLDLLLNEME